MFKTRERGMMHMYGKDVTHSNAKSKKILKLKYSSLEDAILEMI
jgi:hypothetical protein